jgi:hypothetical protein
MKITIVNMIPPSLSGEINADTEPNIAVNPANIRQIAGTAFSLDPNMSGQGPIYVSTDEGNTWDVLDFLPSQPYDQTIRFAGNSDRLYAAIIDARKFRYMLILRKDDITASGTMTEIYSLPRDPNDNNKFFDQPYIQAASVMGGTGIKSDRVYVGGNNLRLWPIPGKTSSIIQTMDAGAGALTFTQVVIEKRATPGSDGPQVRIAIHPDGTVYAVFYGWRAYSAPSVTADVVLVRDDHWGSSTFPYLDLLDPSDGIAGRKIAASVTINYAYLVGNQKTLGHLAIAVDPRDSATVYVAYAELLANVYTLSLVRSTDQGATWSGDLLPVPITNAINPCLAVNSHGKIAYLYQQVTGSGASQHWETHFRTSDDGVMWDDTVLCDSILDTALSDFGLGDYTHIMAVGKDFYGIFPADNTPELANFPATATVIYNRNYNSSTNQLLANDNKTVIPSSIDPFFFKIEELAPEKDFYIRDWTISASDHDSGQEPSTYPWFFVGSDVWNRNTNTPGTFVNDQPQTDPVNAGAGLLGNNFAFARISRNNGSAAETVNAEFLLADYGLGIPYASLGQINPVSFAVGDLQKVISLPWRLDPTASDHCCLAVQIKSVDDPFIPPGLVGYSPGWPTSDLLVINDNNKAQRNISVVHVMTGMAVMHFVRVRNAAFYTRDANIKIDVQRGIKAPGPKLSIEVIDGEPRAVRSGEILSLKKMKPGENRWLSIELADFNADEVSAVHFLEMKNNQVVNGCSILLESASVNNVIRSIAKSQFALLYRMEYGFQFKIDEQVNKINSLFMSSNASMDFYLEHAPLLFLALTKLHDEINVRYGSKAGINFDKEFRILGNPFPPDQLPNILSAHVSVLQKLDALLSMHLLEEGDLACVLSNVCWQHELYSTIEALGNLKFSQEMLKTAKQFIEAYPLGKLTADDYPKLIGTFMDCLKDTAASIESQPLSLDESIAKLNNNMNSLRGLQNAHYEFLLKLNDFFSN